LSFAHPENLMWLWAVLAIPLLYLLRRPAKTVSVPHLFLWERANHNRMPRKRRRLRDLLGLLFQLLIAVSLILAWAGPQSESTSPVERPTLVVIDVSRSMAAENESGQSRLDLAKDWLRENLQALTDAGPTSIALCSNSITPSVPFGAGDARYASFLESSIDFGGELSSLQLMDYTLEVLVSQQEADLILLTDRCFPSSDQDALEELGFRFVVVETPGVNAGFTRFQVEATGQGSAILDATISCFGSGVVSGTVSLIAAGEILSETQVDLASGEERSLAIEADVPPGIWLTLTWTCSNDSFPLDDVLHFWSPEMDRLKVLVVSDQGNRFVKNALAALDGVFDLTAAAQTSSGKWRQAKDYDLTILHGVKERRALPDGAYILLNSWAPNLPFREGLKVDEIGLVRQPKSDELLRGVDLRNLEVKSAYRIKGDRDFETLLEGTSGPLITRGRNVSLSFLHVAFDIRAENSSLVLLPAFPLLIKDAARYLVPKPRRAVPSSLTVGSPFAPHNTESLGGPVFVEFLTEDGETDGFQDLNLDATTGSFRVPEKWGRARVYLGEIQEMCGINVCDPKESNVFPQGAAKPLKTRPAQKEKVSFSDRSSLFFCLALIFLLLEWLCYTRSWTR
jgi:hypothetical protein